MVGNVLYFGGINTANFPIFMLLNTWKVILLFANTQLFVLK